jgi:phosphoribosylformylglycinamidine synthase
MDGCYYADRDTVAMLEDQGRIVFRYATPEDNPNGSVGDIAGLIDPAGTVLGLMPHPERAADPALGNTDGAPFFRGLAEVLG